MRTSDLKFLVTKEQLAMHPTQSYVQVNWRVAALQNLVVLIHTEFITITILQ